MDFRAFAAGFMVLLGLGLGAQAAAPGHDAAKCAGNAASYYWQ